MEEAFREDFDSKIVKKLSDAELINKKLGDDWKVFGLLLPLLVFD
jgi:hypothetical protein